MPGDDPLRAVVVELVDDLHIGSVLHQVAGDPPDNACGLTGRDVGQVRLG